MRYLIDTRNMALIAFSISILGINSVSVAAVSEIAPITQTASDVFEHAAPDQRRAWEAEVKKVGPPPENGCYTMTFPSIKWEKSACTETVGLLPPSADQSKSDISVKSKISIKNSHDGSSNNDPLASGGKGGYVAQTNNLTSAAIGSFPEATVTGVSGQSRAYTLQLNTNNGNDPSFCKKVGLDSGCKNWEQFVYGSDYVLDQSGPQGDVPAGPQVFIQNWIISNALDILLHPCPSGWAKSVTFIFASGCYKNSPAIVAPEIPVEDLGSTTLAGYVSTEDQGGMDTVVLTYKGKAYSVNQPEDTLEIAKLWNQTEFNIVGNGGGSGLTFKPGTALTVNIQVNDGTTDAPQCISGGTTAESNNLTAGSCTATGGDTPSIEFTESSSSTASALQN